MKSVDYENRERELNPIQVLWSRLVSNMADAEDRMRGAEAGWDFVRGVPPVLYIAAAVGILGAFW